MIRNISSVLAALRTPAARLALAGFFGLFIGYGLKSSHANYSLVSSPSGTFRFDANSGKTWVIETQNGRSVWAVVTER